MSTLTDTSRRAVLKKMAALPVASVASPLALQLLGMANASAQTSDDYKALVCVFLNGGNDHYNTVVPYDATNYNDYYNARKGDAVAGTPYEGIALTRSSLTNTILGSSGLPSGMEMALAPVMTGAKSLFDSGKLGILLNVGALLAPTTLTEYNRKSVPLPRQLFSHNDQQIYWHTAGEAEGATLGWGGRMADFVLDRNSSLASLTCVSTNGGSVYLSGSGASTYSIGAKGVVTIDGIKSNQVEGSYACAAALRQLITQSSSHWLEHAHAQITKRALDNYDRVFDSIGAAPSTELASKFSSANSNPLSQQLLMVARLVEKHRDLGLKRQVFFVSMGGFDLHDNLAIGHPVLLDRVSRALFEFNNALEYVGMSPQVTVFTASDFGRTLTSNGDGSDHGWGGHHFIMGGAVNGGRFFGAPPPVGLTHDQQVGHGRLIPSTGLDQMAAELARWFGVSNSDITSVLPNARYFDLHRLGLFRKT